MKQNWGSALFPLSILLVLVGLTFWLRHASEFPNERRDGKYRHDPDYIIHDARFLKMDKTGQLNYTLEATEIRHYPDNDVTDLVQPHLVRFNPNKPPVNLSSDRAQLFGKGEQVDFYDNVRIHRAATPKDEAILVTTTQLTVLPDEDKAYTQHPVLVTQGKSWLKGVGFRVDSREQTYLIESQARALLENKRKGKRGQS